VLRLVIIVLTHRMRAVRVLCIAVMRASRIVYRSALLILHSSFS
jgi:hypothetical protein